MDELIDRVGRRSRGWWRIKEVVGRARGVHIVVHVQIKSAKVDELMLIMIHFIDKVSPSVAIINLLRVIGKIRSG